MAEPRPDDQLVIHDLEALRIMSDALRMRIVEILRRRSATVKDIASILEVPPKSLYYHVNLLEKHGLIRVVDTRLVSGILEKRYMASAYLFVYSDFSGRGEDEGGQGMDVMFSSLFDITREEIRESIASGRIQIAREDAPAERCLQWDWRLLRLRPEDVADLVARLREVIDGYVDADGTPAEAGRQTFRLFTTLFPTYGRGTPSAFEDAEDSRS